MSDGSLGALPFDGSRGTTPAMLHLAIGGATVGAGGLLLGLQVDGTNSLVGTGYTAFGIGAVVALIAMLLHSARGGGLPRDGLSLLGGVCGFFGLAFVVGGVLAPGGAWMFFEVAVLLGFLARRRRRAPATGPEISAGLIGVLALMLLFRLWITYQGSEHRWQVATIDVPVLSWIPLSFLDPIKTIALGSFTPNELGFPPAGLNFPVSMTLWAVGFALCVVGMKWRYEAAVEHENDRIHATIHELPAKLALLVEKLLPEEDWQSIGLHGLSDRRLHKRIEALVTERLTERGELESALRQIQVLGLSNPGGFAGEIMSVLTRHGRAPAAPSDSDLAEPS